MKNSKLNKRLLTMATLLSTFAIATRAQAYPGSCHTRTFAGNVQMGITDDGTQMRVHYIPLSEPSGLPTGISAEFAILVDHNGNVTQDRDLNNEPSQTISASAETLHVTHVSKSCAPKLNILAPNVAAIQKLYDFLNGRNIEVINPGTPNESKVNSQDWFGTSCSVVAGREFCTLPTKGLRGVI